jgi:hypothetical protein
LVHPSIIPTAPPRRKRIPLHEAEEQGRLGEIAAIETTRA